MITMADDISSHPEAAEASSPTQPRITYYGRTWEVAAIAITNLLLAFPTLGFYRFWGKTRLRRYVWSHVEFHGERVEYSGTAKELFIGFLVALGVLIPLAVVFAIAESQFTSFEGESVVRAINFLALFFLIQLARYRARRYRLSRTRWRGIRGAQTGAAWRYALAAMGYTFLSVITLGLSFPLGRTRVQAIRTRNTWFGSEPLTFDARTRSLMPTWLVCWILFVPSFGVSYLWYLAAEFRTFAAHTRVAGFSFSSSLTGGSLLGVLALYVLSIVLIVILAAIPIAWIDAATVLPSGADSPTDASPGEHEVLYVVSFLAAFIGMLFLGILHLLITLQRLFPLLLERLSINGTADFDAIAQSQQEMLSRGEGMADAFDVGEF
jgi:uncharacterized membrane protein YjgN (DUF898 family)